MSSMAERMGKKERAVRHSMPERYSRQQGPAWPGDLHMVVLGRHAEVAQQRAAALAISPS